MTPQELSVCDAPNCDITYGRNWHHQLRLIILLESSVLLLENSYSTGFTYNCHLQSSFTIVKYL